MLPQSYYILDCLFLITYKCILTYHQQRQIHPLRSHRQRLRRQSQLHRPPLPLHRPPARRRYPVHRGPRPRLSGPGHSALTPRAPPARHLLRRRDLPAPHGLVRAARPHGRRVRRQPPDLVLRVRRRVRGPHGRRDEFSPARRAGGYYGEVVPVRQLRRALGERGHVQTGPAECGVLAESAGRWERGSEDAACRAARDEWDEDGDEYLDEGEGVESGV